MGLDRNEILALDIFGQFDRLSLLLDNLSKSWSNINYYSTISYSYKMPGMSSSIPESDWNMSSRSFNFSSSSFLGFLKNFDFLYYFYLTIGWLNLRLCLESFLLSLFISSLISSTLSCSWPESLSFLISGILLIFDWKMLTTFLFMA